MVTEIPPLSNDGKGFQRLLELLPTVLPFSLGDPANETDPANPEKQSIIREYRDLHDCEPTDPDFPEVVQSLLLKILDHLGKLNKKAAFGVSNLICRWHPSSPRSWYERGKLMFQLFIEYQYDHFEDIVACFDSVIELGETSQDQKELVFWSYIFLGNLYLYRILTGEDALEHALKCYNQGYRYANTEELNIDDAFIFENVEIMQQIMMNQFPLLLVIYNETGILQFEYLFQFVEVMSQDKRFIPNFTALLSAVDDHILELFKSPLTSAYLVMENRLLVISSIHDTEGKWVKVAMIFSYLQQSAFNIKIDDLVLDKVNRFVIALQQDSDIYEYLTKFYGRRDSNYDERINTLMERIFSE